MNKKILIVELHHRLGGGQVHSLNKYKMLLKSNQDVLILVPHNTEITKQLEKEGLPHIKTRILRSEFIRPVYKIALAIKLFFICKKYKVDVIHCNKDIEIDAAKLVAKKYPVKIVFTRHVTKPLNIKRVRDIDGFIGVNPEIVSTAKNLNLNIKTFEFIPPFFDENKYINYCPSQTRSAFFEESFKIKLKNCPILCIIANLSDLKNQEIVIKALAKLINQKNTPAQLVLAGIGSQKLYYKNLAKKLEIQDYVYLIGFTDMIPDLLFHSDIKILPSKREGLPITITEAALMKKPIIGTFKTGTEYVIKHEKTGLLFNFDDVETLTSHIERLIENPQFAKELGENACDFVTKNLSNQSKLEKLINFYQRI